MRLFVLGATGRTGSALVAQGLARGHEITTFGRSVFSGEGTSLRMVVGNPMCADDLAAVLPDNDVVLSALGTRGLGATSVLADAVHATIEAMRRASVRRLVIVSSSLLDSNLGWVSRFAGRTILRHHVRDQIAMEKQVTESGLDWTVLRTSRFSKGGLTERYTVTTESEQTASQGPPMSREDVAHMMLDTAECNNHVKEVVRISGPRL